MSKSFRGWGPSEVLEHEVCLFPKKQTSVLRVCLLYPNRYAVAMGNLGYQAVYEILDRAPGVVSERACLPDANVSGRRGHLRSLESGTPIREFDVLAFSVSFETDYIHILSLLDLSGLPLWSTERDERWPLVIAGGPAVFLNPEPIAPFVDLFLIGEAEEMLPEFVGLLGERGLAPRKQLLLEAAQRVAGCYVPQLYEPVYDGPRLVRLDYDGPASPRVERRVVWDLDRFPTMSRLLAPGAVFGDMFLVEASRGCQWGCRFCAAGYMYRPLRNPSVASLETLVREGLQYRRTVGLIGAEMASLPGIAHLARVAAAAGGRLSPSSLKADCVTPELASALASGGNFSATVAPEAGSERMRRVINKNLTEDDILRAARLLVGEGVPDLKLYFMFGLPTEQWEDVEAIATLVQKVRTALRSENGLRSRVGRITVSANPFVPKPWTPFQWDGMMELPELKKRARFLQSALARLPRVRFDYESPREAFYQTLLSRGDRRVAHFLAAVHEARGDWWQTIRAWSQSESARPAWARELPDPEEFVHRTYHETELLPWDFIDHHVSKPYLLAERRKAYAGLQTPPCDTSRCRSCQACPG